jgi:hypothetical protein
VTTTIYWRRKVFTTACGLTSARLTGWKSPDRRPERA